jgi:hypothetical protein
MFDTTNVKVNIEVSRDRRICLYLDRSTDCVMLHWEPAYDLAHLMQTVIDDVKDETEPIDMAELIREQYQIRLNVHKGLICLVFDWGNRFYYHWRSFQVFQQALRVKIQDVQFAERQVVMPTLSKRHAKAIPKLRDLGQRLPWKR